MSQDDEYDAFDAEFDFNSQNDCESQQFTVLSANDVVDLMKNETEKVREVVNVSAIVFLEVYKTKVLSYSSLQRNCECSSPNTNGTSSRFWRSSTTEQSSCQKVDQVHHKGRRSVRRTKKTKVVDRESVRCREAAKWMLQSAEELVKTKETLKRSATSALIATRSM